MLNGVSIRPTAEIYETDFLLEPGQGERKENSRLTNGGSWKMFIFDTWSNRTSGDKKVGEKIVKVYEKGGKRAKSVCVSPPFRQKRHLQTPWLANVVIALLYAFQCRFEFGWELIAVFSKLFYFTSTWT